ncbi:MAG: helix-turn-helix transcriptional regulator [Lachnospiraceae bacterium]|nr:helix-turn-helix transcriptional regulator [Lachnospiraceae bacterium]
MYGKNILLKVLREKGVTYKQLSRKSGISVSSLYYIANQVTDPKQSTMIAIARALDMKVADIFNLDWRNQDER